MTRIVSIALPLLLAACAAGTPSPTAHAPSSCDQLAAALSQAETERHLATEQKENAWKAVIPFAVAARYAKSKSAADEAEQRRQALRQQAAVQGCPIQQGS